MDKEKSCTHLEDFLKEQVTIIERHIDEHKYFSHIEDKGQATLDFINRFGWVMREAYCDMCSGRPDCESYKNYLDTKGWRKYVK